MKLIGSIFNSNKKNQSKDVQTAEQTRSDSLIQTGRQQFKKLNELGLQIPIAVL